MKDPFHYRNLAEYYTLFPEDSGIFSHLVHMAPQKLYIFSEDKRLYYANRQGMVISPLPPEKITIETFCTNFLDKLDLIPYIEETKRGKTISLETGFFDLNKKRIPAEIRFLFMPVQGKGFFFVVLYNIIERKFREALIVEKNRVIESLARFPEENPLPVLRFDINGELSYENSAGNKLSEILKEDKVPGQLEKWNQTILTAFQEDKLQTLEIEIEDSFFDCTFSPVKKEKYLYIYANDITTQRLSERQMQKILKQQELLSEISYDFNRHDLAFKDKINTTLCKIGESLGISRIYIFEDSADGKFTANTFEWCNKGIDSRINSLQNLQYDSIRGQLRELLKSEGCFFSSDIQQLSKDFRTILEKQNIRSIIVFPINAGQHQMGFVGFDECSLNRNWDENTVELLKTVSHLYSNEYQRKIDNEKLIKSKLAAEAGSRAKELFLANMSHEIRTPMNVIVGMGNLLGTTTLDEKQNGYLEAIRTSAENLLVIINDILDFSKIQSGKIELESIPFNLKELVHLAVKSQSVKAAEKNLIMDCVFDDKIDPHLIGDPFRLNQIFLNLLNNAMKFTEQGSVTLTCKLVESREKKTSIYFEVKDTGQGIEIEKSEEIFESFQQGDPSITRKFGGTGLGLTITKQLVQLFGGTINLKSEINEGTVFFFTITFDKANKKDIQKKDNVSIDKNLLKGKRVLIVEDNEFNRMVAISLLEQWNIVTDYAENGQVGLQKLKSHPYDLVLMDIQMPVLGGIEATKIIRNELKLSVPIIALTANALKSDKEK